ncbi:MAG: hypothetical protein K0U39_01485 [Alphaproteobacteria bacterium]|nr:hypothetical protein [Alphaproteobacteria bacterium]
MLIECTDNHDHHVTDCIELTQPTSEEIVKSSDQQEEELLAMKKILDETEKTLQERQKLLDKSREELGLK